MQHIENEALQGVATVLHREPSNGERGFKWTIWKPAATVFSLDEGLKEEKVKKRLMELMLVPRAW